MTNKHLSTAIKELDPLTLQRGKDWYLSANKFARRLADTYHVHIANVAAVISALSPGCKWSRNKEDAERLIVCYVSGGDWRLLPFATYSANVAKAWTILSTPPPAVPEQFNRVTSLKTQAFYFNILSPHEGDYVTIDRHMAAILDGRLGEVSGSTRVTPKQYREASQAIKRAAKKAGLLPHELQAALWEHHINKINNPQNGQATNSPNH